MISIDLGRLMSECFRKDHKALTTPFGMTHGRTMWEIMRENTRMNKAFNKMMSCNIEMVMSVTLKDGRHVFYDLESLVDVGGGTGIMARIIAHQFPGLNCTVLDLPHVVHGLKGTEILKFMEGDIFHAIPSAQAVSLKFILHDWSDKECIQILGKCKEAIPSKENGGKVIIIDIVIGDKKDNIKTQLFMDMMMMILVDTRKERTEKQWANIFLAAGFTTYKITPILGLMSVIEVFP